MERDVPTAPPRRARLQNSTETFFRNCKFWKGGGDEAPPAFIIDGVTYMHIKASSSCRPGRTHAPPPPPGDACARRCRPGPGTHPRAALLLAAQLLGPVSRGCSNSAVT